jgi:hypothetical protein
MPRSSARFFKSGISSTSRSAAFSVLITSGGVPLGAKIAFHDRASKSPPPASFTVGTSGRNAVRIAPEDDTAMAALSAMCDCTAL